MVANIMASALCMCNEVLIVLECFDRNRTFFCFTESLSQNCVQGLKIERIGIHCINWIKIWINSNFLFLVKGWHRIGLKDAQDILQLRLRQPTHQLRLLFN